MFDKLKIKFIVINMSLLTSVFIAIFSTIFYITYSNVNNQVKIDLDFLVNNRKLPPHVIYVITELDKENKIDNIVKSFDTEINTDSFQEVIYDILNKNKSYDIVNIDDSPYSYLIHKSEFGTKIAFIDRTNIQNLLIELFKSFFVIISLSLILLLLISIYFTNKSIEPIKEAFDKQKEFITNASHELKTPLTIIKTNLSLILSNKNDTINNQIKWINYINDQTNRMSTLINEMLSLSKLDIDENKIILEKINIRNIIESMLLMFDAIIYENNITLETNISKDLFINGNKENIKKLFSILMDNAIKYTNKNGKINVYLYSKKNKIILIVENTGYGIPKESIDKIFERFYRVDDSRHIETGGYGIGLSIANAIVKQHSGKIFANSELNKTTSFIVELPQQK